VAALGIPEIIGTRAVEMFIGPVFCRKNWNGKPGPGLYLPEQRPNSIEIPHFEPFSPKKLPPQTLASTA